METKYYKVEDRYIKVVNENSIICVWDNKIIPSIDKNMVPRHYLVSENEIKWSEFYDAFDKVHQMLRDLLLDIQYNEGSELTPTIAQLVRNYDRAVQYIECSGQRRTQEEKNNKILSKLKNLGVKSFEGITISTTEA